MPSGPRNSVKSSSRRKTAHDRKRKDYFRPALESLEPRMVLSAAGIPFGAQDTDTGEYMIGDVAVTVVFMESNGVENPDTENWTEPVKTRVKQTIEEGLQWWEDAFDLQNSVHDLNFILDYQYADTPVETDYEPITNYSGQFNLWVDDFYDAAGAQRTGDIVKDSRLFNNTQRITHEADWAFTIIVANAENDSDGFFPAGGIRGAYSVAGGSFIVMPSTRSSATVAHETAHQFWAYDEYTGVSSNYDSTRGYYNTQNTNSFNGRPANADPVVDSVMLAGSYMTRALANHTSSPASFEAIGWRDSDNDGIFDVLDVPLTLSGSGSYDSNSQTYRFIAETGVNALPNINSQGNQNDITINRVQEIQYRIDGGAWQLAETVDANQASVDLTISIANDQVHTIDFRAVDPTGFVTSATFSGTTDQITPSASVGFNGSVYRDINLNGVHDTGEPGLDGWTLEVLDSISQTVDFTQSIEPDDYNNSVFFESGTVDGIVMSAFGPDINEFFPLVASRASSHHSTGTKVFANYGDSSWRTLWSASSQIKIEFDSPVAKVSLDAVANSVSDFGRMEAYNSNGNKIARYTTNQLSTGQHESMVIELDSADIAYVIAWGHSGSEILLDNLQVGHSSTTTTDTLGAFTLPFSEAGNYNIKATAPNGQESILIPTDELSAAFSGTAKIEALNFGAITHSTEWNNPWDDSDINDDGKVDTTDVNLLFNELQNLQYTQATGPGNSEFITSHQDGVPYFDANNDSILNPLDLLVLMDRLASESQAENSEPELIPLNHVIVHDTLVSSPSTISEFPASQPELELESSLNDTSTNSKITDPKIYLIESEPMRQTIAAKKVETPVKLTQKPTSSPALLDTLYATLSQLETNPVTEISKEVDAQETSADVDLIISDDQWIDELFS